MVMWSRTSFFRLDEVVEIKPHRHEILLQVVDLLLERDEDTGFVVIGDPPGDELHRKERLPASRAAADKCRPAFRQPSAGDIVKAFDPGGDLSELVFSCARRSDFSCIFHFIISVNGNFSAASACSYTYGEGVTV